MDYYSILKKTEPYHLIISTSITSAISFGAVGFTCGLFASALDTYLVNSRYTDKYYISSMIAGINLLTPINPSKYTYFLGALAGLGNMILIGNEDKYEYLNKILPYFQSIIFANNIFKEYKYYGYFLGFGCAALDDLLLQFNYTEKHYCTNIISSYSIVQILSKSQGFIKDISPKFYNLFADFKYIDFAISGILASYFIASEQEDTYSLTGFKMQNDFINSTSYIVDKQDVILKQQIQSIININFQTIFGQSLLKQVNYYLKAQMAFYTITSDDIAIKLNAWHTIKVYATKCMMSLIGRFLLEGFNDDINWYYNTEISRNIIKKIREKWLNGDTALKLFQTENNVEVFMDNLQTDMYYFLQGNSLSISFTANLAAAIFGLQRLIKHNAEDISIVYYFYYKLSEFFTNLITERVIFYDEARKTLESQEKSTRKHAINNINIITLRDGVDYIKEEMNILDDEIHLSSSTKYFWEEINKRFELVKFNTDILIDWIIIGFKVYQGMSNDIRGHVSISAVQVNKIISWYTKNSLDMARVKLSMEKIISFISKIDSISNTNKKGVEYNFLGGNHLILDNITVKIEDKILFYINDSIKLEIGHIYAFTGRSGSGKSTLFAMIKGLTENKLFADGKISYPSFDNTSIPTISMLPQADYIPFNSTLFNIIRFPQTDKTYKVNIAAISSPIIKILSDLELCNNEAHMKNECNILEWMNEKKDWDNILSGGQKKKILLSSVLLQDSDIILLDETFAGLDKTSIKLAQNSIKQYATDSIVIIIDHNAHENNYDDFYYQNIHINNDTSITVDYLN